MNTDQILIVVAISAYIVSALALLSYFLSRDNPAKLIGIPFAFAGCALQFVELVYRYQTSHIWPLTNLYGSLSLFSAMSVAIFIGFAIKYDVWFIGGFVEVLAASFLAYALTWNEGYLPAVPALQSYWIKIHVPLVVSSYAAFMVAAVTSVLFLIKYYGQLSLERNASRFTMNVAPAGGPPLGGGMQLQAAYTQPVARKIIGGEFPVLRDAAASGDRLALWLATLPSLAKLDILTYRVVAVGLPLLTLGVITGAWWAKEAWGAYWQWDPKETAALVSWTVYALYMHLHTRNSWRGFRCAWLSVLGFATIMFCYLGVNIWISGLHSYKM
jgi:cytochrome c-type biogenesis protein CcsB